jgi:exonuclease SbcC
MRITRLSLRNFRVFADLDLGLPDGVVGIFGPNGSGKSTLVEAITWALFGVARTGKDALRADGSEGECRVVVEFDHDGHLYEVTRALSGTTANVSAEAACDGLRLAAGATSVRQYVHQVLGMSADAFRASVCCEQKQVDAFSGRRPEERRRLVLDLLGITPLDRARDAARAKARAAAEAVEAARLVLGDLDTLADEVATLDAAHAEAASARAGAEDRAQAAAQTATAAETAANAAEAARQERDRLRARWEEASRRRHELAARLAGHEEELRALTDAASRLPALESSAASLDAARARLRALEVLDAARRRLAQAQAAVGNDDTVVAGDDPTGNADEEAARRAREAGEAAGRVRGREAALAGAEANRRAAAAEVEAASRLDPDAPCPLCGQELGTCFEDVASARTAALAEADVTWGQAAAELEAARAEQVAAERRAAEAEANRAAVRARAEHLLAARMELESAHQTLAEAEAEAETGLAGAGGSGTGDVDAQRTTVLDCEAARDEAVRLAERVARVGRLEAEITAERVAMAEAETVVARLVEEGRAVGFDAAAHAGTLAAHGDARAAAEGAREALVDARLAERGLAERLAERRERLEAERQRRGDLAGHEDEARHLGRLAELLGEFRNSLVGQVGPALSSHTTALFRELTDARFESLEVDPDTFELRIGVAGGGHPLDRHSGSETDLANLSLRIAIGEQVNLLSGGQVGVLVLDEVLGSLDAEHRDRLLGALTRLSGRFHQVFVVTHATEIKERLPQAIEVVPLSRGRSTARLAGSVLRLAEAG